MTEKETKQPPLHQAAKIGDVAEVNRLIAEGADVWEKDDHGRTALNVAAWMDGNTHLSDSGGIQIEIILILINAGAEVNETDKNGDTPLHQAAYGGYGETARVLVNLGADVHARNNNGETPVDFMPDLE